MENFNLSVIYIICVGYVIGANSSSIEKPQIDVASNGKIFVGEPMVLNCTLRVDSNVYVDMEWDVPDKKGLKSGRINFSGTYIDRLRHGLGRSAITVKNVTFEDAGNYTCTVRDHVNNTNNVSREIIVLSWDESYINLSSNIDNITVNIGENVTWVVDIDANPEVTDIWFQDKWENLIEDDTSSNYKVYTNTTRSILYIFDANFYVTRGYVIFVKNKMFLETLTLEVVVVDLPEIILTSDQYNIVNEESELECEASGFPLPEVTLFVKPCKNNDCAYKAIKPTQYLNSSSDFRATVTVNILANFTGSVKCFANNSFGNATVIKDFFVTDVNDGFDVWGIDGSSYTDAIAGENVTINCGASIYDYSDINWYISTYYTRYPIPDDKRFRIVYSKSNYSHQVSLNIDSIQLNDSGSYECAAKSSQQDGDENSSLMIIEVKKPLVPKIIDTNLDDSEIKKKTGTPVTLKCKAEGDPSPKIKWKKNDVYWFVPPNSSHITLSEDNSTLSFKYLEVYDEGEYSCNATSKYGYDFRKINLTLFNSNKANLSVIISVILAIMFVFLCAVLIVKIRKEKKLRRELKKAGLQHFEKGALESLNPDLGVDDQAELLPYNKKWEFPRYKLKLGKQLGSGAFGVVLKADAYGICKREIVSTVAVKMVKPNTDYTYIKALASELKIMGHLGKHLNVVNLLGACTKNIAEQKLLVIVEYCCFGNIHNYLLRHRDNFVNQIDPETDTIDDSIGADEGTYSTFAPTPTNSSYTGSTAICSSSGEDTTLSSNNSAQPEWRSNYRGDYNRGNVKPISTHDLLCWAFQVARGMEYLASRKVLHGDLAARNILLAEENIVKICDFGLAKSMYKSDNYMKKGDGPLPVKWMSVESIQDRVFSTQSDVWSYGIVLWEFFSLAKTPYPGMIADERLYNNLLEGYRMDKPEFATKNIYQIMLECWDANPVNRPSFNKLAESLASMLQQNARQHYISLNDPYIKMNNSEMEGHSDYLALLSPPDYRNLVSPSCFENVKGSQIPEDPAAEANRNTQKEEETRDDIDCGAEILPSLRSNVDSDCKLPSQTSETESFANSNYNKFPDKNQMIKPTDPFPNPNYIYNKKLELSSNENTHGNYKSRNWE